ncbi:MAG TPA: metalloregulator ArsR/SmtB family transcription factor [Streptosporangiales bacterium]
MKNVGIVQESAGATRGTRERVFRLVLELGPVTAADLADRLDLTPAAVRRHLDALLELGYVADRTAPCRGQRGRGRPARAFVITEAGRDAFYQGYDDLAASALRYVGEIAGPEAVAAFARHRVAELERRYRQHLAGVPEGERAEALAKALSGDGYAASVGATPFTGGGEQLCQHHCPVAHVAAEFPQLCEAETEAFARLLGIHVQRLATIARGDGVCTTHVPARGLQVTEKITEKRPSGRTSA